MESASQSSLRDDLMTKSRVRFEPEGQSPQSRGKRQFAGHAAKADQREVPLAEVNAQPRRCSRHKLRRRAVHESGHALVALILPECYIEEVWISPFREGDENGEMGICHSYYQSELDRVCITAAGRAAVREVYGRLSKRERLDPTGDTESAIAVICEMLGFPEWDEIYADDPRESRLWEFYHAAENLARTIIRAHREKLDALTEALCRPPHRLNGEQACRIVWGDEEAA